MAEFYSYSDSDGHCFFSMLRLVSWAISSSLIPVSLIISVGCKQPKANGGKEAIDSMTNPAKIPNELQIFGVKLCIS